MTPLDRLTCEEVFRRLDDYLDRELNEEETARMKAHLDTCAQCAHELAFDRQVLDEVRAKVQRIATPPDLRGRVAEAIARAARERETG